MTKPLIITPEAEQDFADARAWYNCQSAGLGDAFLLSVDEAFLRIRLIPTDASEIHPGVRRVVLRRFPYSVVYRVDNDQIGVIAVYHSSRGPRGWQSRL